MRGSKKWIVYAGLAVLVGAGSWGTTSWIYRDKLNSQEVNFQAILQDKNQQIEKYTLSSKQGFIVVKELQAGDIITKDHVRLSALPDYFVPADIITSERDIIGKVVKLNTKLNAPVTLSMVYDDGKLEDTLRKAELNFVALPYRLSEKDVIDIRIVFPNGEDYYVLTKKKMTGLDLSSQLLFMDIDIEEILLLKSALRDSHENRAEIYAMQYVEPEMQAMPNKNYVPNLDVLNLIKADPRIGNKDRYSTADISRKALDERLKALPLESMSRLGDDLPAGSTVASRRKTVGASITIIDGNSATPREDIPTNSGNENVVTPSEETAPTPPPATEPPVEDVEFEEPPVDWGDAEPPSEDSGTSIGDE